MITQQDQHPLVEKLKLVVSSVVMGPEIPDVNKIEGLEQGERLDLEIASFIQVHSQKNNKKASKTEHGDVVESARPPIVLT